MFIAHKEWSVLAFRSQLDLHLLKYRILIYIYHSPRIIENIVINSNKKLSLQRAV